MTDCCTMLHLHITVAAAAASKSLQSCPTLCNPIDGSPLGSVIPGILQARTLEWVAIAFSNAFCSIALSLGEREMGHVSGIFIGHRAGVLLPKSS